VPADLVVLDQNQLAGEQVGELPGPQAADQVLLQLLPQWLTAAAVKRALCHPASLPPG
jgi:hypothetical protein